MVSLIYVHVYIHHTSSSSSSSTCMGIYWGNWYRMRLCRFRIGLFIGKVCVVLFYSVSCCTKVLYIWNTIHIRVSGTAILGVRDETRHTRLNANSHPQVGYNTTPPPQQTITERINPRRNRTRYLHISLPDKLISFPNTYLGVSLVIGLFGMATVCYHKVISHQLRLMVCNALDSLDAWQDHKTIQVRSASSRAGFSHL